MARQAIVALAAMPVSTLPLLGEQLRHENVPARQIATWIEQLGSDAFTFRTNATDKLKALGDEVEDALRLALKKNPDAESHHRLERLLKELMHPVLTPDQVREVRAIEVLERIGNTQAREVLNKLAKGGRTTRRALEAQAALERLNRRTGAP